MKRILAGILIALILTFNSAAATLPQQDFHDLVSNATFALYGIKGNVRHFLCTATAIERTADGYNLLTAGHCVLPPDIPEGVKFYVAESIEASPVLQTVTVEKAALTDKYDFAFLHLKTTRVYPAISVSHYPLPSLETLVVAVNFSEGLIKQVSRGVVSSGLMNPGAADGKCNICTGRFMVQISAGPGASGSAVIDEGTHEIVGLIEGGIPRSNVGAICIPVSRYWDFLVDGTATTNTLDKSDEDTKKEQK